MSVARSWLAWCLVTVTCWLFATSAAAHDVRPAVLALQETAPGVFDVHWSAPTLASGVPTRARPEFPSHCVVAERRLDCGRAGLVGEIAFSSEVPLSRVTVSIAWADAPATFRIVTGDAPAMTVLGTPREASVEQRVELVGTYVLLGIEHIVFGPDHLMFVVGLLLLLDTVRVLVWTITAFTLAHSVTLAAASLDWMTPSVPVVELVIALSILLLALEVASPRTSWTKRAPWAVAFTFGLLHGFGFASALSEIGLPPRHVALSLVSFNLGVELGQLGVVGLSAMLWRFVARWDTGRRWGRTVTSLLLGSTAVFWCLERAVSLARSWDLAAR